MKTLLKTVALFVAAQLLGVSIVFAGDDPIKPIQNENQIFGTPDYTGSFLDRSTITGDWGGTRQSLANQGVTIDANLTQVTQGVTSGGLDTGWEYSGRGETTLNLDTAKMGLWPGGLLTVMGEGNFGSPLNPNTGSLLGTNANELFPELENSFVLPNLTYTQFLSPKFGIALGKFATISNTAGDMNEFAHGKGSQQFLSPTLNFNPTLALTVPYSTLGVTAIFLPVEELMITAAIVNPQGKPSSSGFNTLFKDGMSFVAEGRYKTNLFGMKGHQLIGGSYSTLNYVDLDQRVANLIFPNLPVQKADDSWSAYWNMDQYFYQPDSNLDRGVGFFARYGMSDGKANPIENFASAGIGAKGLIPGRENDGSGLGYFYTWVANNRITNVAGLEDSQGIETYYEFALTPSIRLTPSVQWLEASQKRVDSSWVTGMRVFTAF